MSDPAIEVAQRARDFDLGGEWEPTAVECDGKVVWSERNE